MGRQDEKFDDVEDLNTLKTSVCIIIWGMPVKVNLCFVANSNWKLSPDEVILFKYQNHF